jgi:hypothetical protein
MALFGVPDPARRPEFPTLRPTVEVVVRSHGLRRGIAVPPGAASRPESRALLARDSVARRSGEAPA